MAKLYRSLPLAIFTLLSVFMVFIANAQKPDGDEGREGGKRHLKSWPRQKITHKVMPITLAGVVNFQALADSEKINLPAPVHHFNLDPGEALEEKFKYKPRPVPRGSHVTPVPPAANNRMESPAPLLSFNGVLDNNTEVPPDIQGAAGPVYVMETTNQEFDIYKKTSALQTALQVNTFFSVTGSNYIFDPHILYDPNYSVFIVVVDDVLPDGNSGLGIAISETSDPTGNWYVYSYDAQIPFTNNTLLDYPELGFNTNWVVITGNDFTNTGVIAQIYVMDRATLYAGTLGTVNNFSDNNVFTWVPAQTYDIAEGTEYMVQDANGDEGGNGYMQVGTITGTPDNPAYNAGTDIGVTQTWSETDIGAGQKGSDQTIDDDDTRVMNGVVYLNNSLWFTHNVFLPATDNPTYTGVDWWQINPSAMTVLQYGRVADNSGQNTNYYYPSLNVNSNGDALLEYCISGTDSFYSGAAYSFHAGADPLSTMESRYIFKSGLAAYYKTDGGGRNRWGDFTGTAVDPTDNSFWTFGQWAQTGDNWGSQIAHIGASGADTLPPVVDFSVNTDSSICNGVFQFTDMSTNEPTSWHWNFGDGDTSNLQDPTHQYTTNGTYTVTLTATNAHGSGSKTDTDYITVSLPPAPVAPDVSHCGASSFSLSATTTNPVSWFDSSGAVVSSANPYTTPVLTRTTTYWVADSVLQGIDSVGPANENVLGVGGYFSNSTDRYLIFNALSAFTLISVVVDAESSGERTIALRDGNGNTLQFLDINLAGGIQTVTLNFNIATGINYELAINGPSNLYRNNEGTYNASANFYPFIIPGVVSITASNAGSGWYYYFYNWKVQGLPCVSARTAVTATITAGFSITPDIASVLCNGGDNGSVSITPTGGTPSYKYVWSNGQTTNPATDLTAGTYEVTVTDSIHCSVTASETVTQPQALSLTVSSTNAGCGSTAGTAKVSATGGTAGYTYHWNTGATIDSISGLSPNTYSVTVTDAHSCSSTAEATIINSGSLDLSVTATNPGCYGTSSGSATATVTGDPHTINYIWNTGATTSSITNVAAGTYTVSASDITGCSASATQIISQPDVLDVSVTEVNSNCISATGSATASPTGGTSGYSYLWSNAGTTATITGLTANTYQVTVTDAHSCTATASATIINSGTLTVSDITNNVKCYGTATGSVSITVPGDTGHITYVWNTGATTASLTNIQIGNYSVTVTVASGCTATLSQQVSQPTVLSVTVGTVNSGCGFDNGSASANVSGGTPGYSYLWSNDSATVSIRNLAANTYNVTVTDSNGCTATSSASIVNASTLIANFTTTNASCYGIPDGGASVSVTSGVSPFSYLWSTGATTSSVSNVVAGNYEVSITDGTGCTQVDTLPVGQPTEIVISISDVQPTCGSVDNGSAVAGVRGGNPSYTFRWSNGSASDTINNLSAGTYSVTVHDLSGCSASSAVMLNTGASITANPVIEDVSCYGGKNASAYLTVGGGTAPYSLSWSNGSSGDTATALAAGNYTVTITDQRNCSVTTSVVISQPAQIQVVVSSTAATSGRDNGTASVDSVDGGTPPFAYLWSTGQTTATAGDLTTGTYTVTITDQSGCVQTASVSVNEVTGVISAGGTLNFNVYPNPARNEITIEFNTNGEETFMGLKDVLGQTLAVTQITGNKTIVNLAKFAAGVYFVELRQGDKNAVQQVIIAR